jgi:transposase
MAGKFGADPGSNPGHSWTIRRSLSGQGNPTLISVFPDAAFFVPRDIVKMAGKAYERRLYTYRNIHFEDRVYE